MLHVVFVLFAPPRTLGEFLPTVRPGYTVSYDFVRTALLPSGKVKGTPPVSGRVAVTTDAKRLCYREWRNNHPLFDLVYDRQKKTGFLRHFAEHRLYRITGYAPENTEHIPFPALHPYATKVFDFDALSRLRIAPGSSAATLPVTVNYAGQMTPMVFHANFTDTGKGIRVDRLVIAGESGHGNQYEWSFSDQTYKYGRWFPRRIVVTDTQGTMPPDYRERVAKGETVVGTYWKPAFRTTYTSITERPQDRTISLRSQRLALGRNGVVKPCKRAS